MQFTIRHEIRCAFDRPAGYSIRTLRLTPREESGISIDHWQVGCAGAPARGTPDVWGNMTHQIILCEPHESLRIVASGTLNLHGGSGRNPACGKLPVVTYLASTPLTCPSHDLQVFSRRYLDTSTRLSPLMDMLSALQARYAKAPSGGEPVLGAALAFERKRITLQDRIHITLTVCRLAGIPARFVSGYQLHAQPSEHAWAEIWLKDRNRWISLDTQNATPTSGPHVRLAVGRDYLDTCPMRMVHSGGGPEEVRTRLRML